MVSSEGLNLFSTCHMNMILINCTQSSQCPTKLCQIFIAETIFRIYEDMPWHSCLLTNSGVDDLSYLGFWKGKHVGTCTIAMKINPFDLFLANLPIYSVFHIVEA